MDSWWQLGEGHGSRGHELAMYQITCPFCMERGNFKTAFHAEKKKPNSEKKLNFDTLECGNCKGYVMVQDHERNVEVLRNLPSPPYTQELIQQLVDKADANFRAMEWASRERLREKNIRDRFQARHLGLFGLSLVAVGSFCQSLAALLLWLD